MSYFNEKNTIYLSVIFSLLSVFFLKDLIIYKPISYYLIAVHEMMHGFFALITGGTLHKIQLGDFGGLAYTSGGFRPFISMGGYIGTSIIGGLFIYLSHNEKYIDWFIYIFSTMMFFTFIIYIDNYFNLFFISVLFFTGLLLLSTKLHFTRYISIFIGTLFLFDSLSDSKAYLFSFITGQTQRTDADILAEWFGCGCFSIIIGLIIFVLSMLIYYITIKRFFKKTT